MKQGYTSLPLMTNKNKLFVNFDRLEDIKNELQLFLEDIKYMNSKHFSLNVLFSQEIKANNTIEGYCDDVGLVYDILHNNLNLNDKERMLRIKNLSKGYKYILNGYDITKYTLRKLYNILSNGLLSNDDIKNMGEFYRNNPVYIYHSNNITVEPDIGVDPKKIEKHMNEFFDYVNSNNQLSSSTDYFIKSQIMHFQFVNIHPYFDINGRTSRTCSMWYLLNNEIYPYIIFNRAISLNKNTYYKVIREAKKYHNVTYFLKYMLENVKIELEKEYIIDMIKSCSDKLSAIDYQTIYYVLSMKGLLSVKDFIKFYNSYNDKKKPIDIYNQMIQPLLDKSILVKERETGSFLKYNLKNFTFKINESKYEIDPNKIKKLELKKDRN